MKLTMLFLSALALIIALFTALAWYAFWVPGRSYEGPLPALTPSELDLASRLEVHVRAIASVPHNIGHYDDLEKAAAYIERTLEKFGYEVGRQTFKVSDRVVRNIDATIEPHEQSEADTTTLVIGAHYDSFFDAPGANDNGTGVAATLELARLLKGMRLRTTRLRFVLFVNEEPPYFRTADMGSWRYAKLLKERNEKVRGMISMETIGAFSERSGSQRYPWPLDKIFPDKGNFLAFVALPGSRRFLHQVIGSFRKNTKFPTIAGLIPDQIEGAGWSDHWSFYKFGFPAIMITDTAPFRYPHYHLTSDTPDKVQYKQLARITKGLEAVLREIAH